MWDLPTFVPIPRFSKDTTDKGGCGGGPVVVMHAFYSDKQSSSLWRHRSRVVTNCTTKRRKIKVMDHFSHKKKPSYRVNLISCWFGLSLCKRHQ